MISLLRKIRTRFRLFGGALAKVEGRARLQPSWALLLTDLLVFARVSRDRVLFVTEEPLRLSSIAEACFTVRKRPTEFRLQVAINANGNPENGHAEVVNSGGCSPHSRLRRRVLVLRAPSPELKAVWHNLLQRQMWVTNVVRSRDLSSRDTRGVWGMYRVQSNIHAYDFHFILASMWIQAVAWAHRRRTAPRRIRSLVVISSRLGNLRIVRR